MFSQLNCQPNLEHISQASHYGARAGLDTMGESGTESVVRSNGTASSTQLLHNIETLQSRETLFSSSFRAQAALDKIQTSTQLEGATKGKGNCNNPTESSPHNAKILSSSDSTCGSHDFDLTKSPGRVNATSRDTNDQVAKANSHHAMNEASSSFIGLTTAASPELSEPIEEPTLVAVSQIVHDNSTYSIGDIKVYNQAQKEIPRLYQARWQVISPEIFDRVHKRLGRGRFAVKLNKWKAPPIIELASAGATKAISVPAILVVIPRHIKTMQDFLNTDSTVQSRCKPADGTTVELLALACKGCGIRIGLPNNPPRNELDSESDSNSEPWSDAEDFLSSADGRSSGDSALTTSGVLEVEPEALYVVHDPTYLAGNVKHGMGILLCMKDGRRYVRGTCGGLLQLMVPNQPPRQVGLIAGHLLEQMGQDLEEGNGTTTGTSLIIGGIVYPKSTAELPRHDWALFDATKLSFERKDTIENNVSIAQEPDFPDISTEVVVRTSKGEMTGTLSSTPSGIMLQADQGFVQVRAIMMDKDSILTRGDSGSWVFHREYLYVYGYIIATNGNCQAYMVPMHLTTAEIQKSLGATSVCLTISTDPVPQIRPPLEATQEHFEQTDRSILPDIDEAAQKSSVFSFPSTYHSVESNSFHQHPRGSTHEHIGQTERVPSDTDESIRRSSIFSSIFSLSNASARLPYRDVHRYPRSYSPTIPSPTTSLASLQGQLRLRDQSQLRLVDDRIAKALLREGRVAEAIKIFESILEKHENILDPNHTDYLESSHELAVAYTQNGQATEAIRLLRDVVEKEAGIFHDEDIGRLTSQHELARAYLADGQFSEAIRLLESVVAVKASTLHSSDPHLLTSQIVLAEAYFGATRASDAIKILNHIVAVATEPSKELEKIRDASLLWLDLARRQRAGLDSARPPGQRSKPTSIFISPREYA